MNHALALLEYSGVAVGVAAVDLMLKQSPVALLRCGSVHPGRYLALVGGSVASTEEAYVAGTAAGGVVDKVFLAAPHPALRAAVEGARLAPAGDAVGLCETSTAPGLLRAVDAVLKAVPVGLVEVRLADDLGGRSLVIFAGHLSEVQEALQVMAVGVGPVAEVLASALLPRLEETLRDVLTAGTEFKNCANWTPAGAEVLTDEG